MLSMHLRQIRGRIYHLPSNPEIWPDCILRMRKQDVVIMFDFRRYQASLTDLARTIAEKRQAQIVTVTDKWLTPASRYADHVLAVPIEIGTAWDSQVSAVMLIEAMIVRISEQDWDATRKRIEQWDDTRLTPPLGSDGEADRGGDGTVKREPMVLACTSDIAGKMRGKAFPESAFEKRLQRGIGWTPTNVQITCFDAIAESPYGALGDLVLIPDPETRVTADFEDGLPAEQFVIGDILQTTGEAWECCTRSILKAALERLEKVGGVSLFSAFEHEFHFKGSACPLGSGYTTAGFRAEREFAETLTAMMRDAGLAPDTFMKEYGVDQYEVTMSPAGGVSSADRAVVLRELVHTTAARLGREASFTPLRDPAGVGNGVHIHMSFRDANGAPATYDRDGKHGLSAKAGQFVAGILKYLDRIVAMTAPSVVSYTRLTPHRWSAAYNNLGFRDREASVRICPVSDLSDIDKAGQYNFEFRAGDAAASPYLALAAIVHAGTQGIEEGLDCPDATEEDLSLLSPADLTQRGYVRLPQTLDAALEKFAAEETVTGWFPDGFANIYALHKQGEMDFLKDMSEAEICAAYEEAY